MAAAEDIYCANCDRTKNVMKRCTGCLQTFYCSRECQRKHWPSHKQECVKARAKANKFLPDEKHGSNKVNTNSDKKSLPHLENQFASTKVTKIYASQLGTKEVDIQCRKNKSKCDSHNQEFWARSKGQATEQLQQLSSPDSDVGDLKQRKCLLSAQEHTVAADLNCKDKTGSAGTSTFSEDGNTNVSEVNPISSPITIFIKHNKAKHTLKIPTACVNNGKSIWQCISDFLHIPMSKLKLIHKGKMATLDNIECFLSEKALFQAFGEVAETEHDLDKSDIDLITKQAGVDRNTAIKALRNAGTVIDAIIDLGNE